MTAAGSATTVVVDSTLAIYATPDVDISSVYFDGTKFVLTLTGVGAGDVVITAELKEVTYVAGVRTLTAFDTPITDTLTITVTAE